VTAKAGAGGGSGIGGGESSGIGYVTIGGQAVVWASAAQGAGIGGNGTQGAAAGHYVKINHSATVVASGRYAGIGGSTTGTDLAGTVTISGGFVAARASAASYYAIGGVSGVTISGGSVHPAVGTKGVSGVQAPVDGDGTPVYPLYIPAYSGVDLTDLGLAEADGFPYDQHTITEEQRAFIAAKDTAAFPLPGLVPATVDDGANGKLAATLWAPAGQLGGITLRGTGGFAANVTSGAIPVYSASLGVNVLRNQTATVNVTANGTPYEVTSTELVLSFDTAVPDLAVTSVKVTAGTTSVTTNASGWATDDGVGCVKFLGQFCLRCY
jgi:hypothetical protein